MKAFTIVLLFILVSACNAKPDPTKAVDTENPIHNLLVINKSSFNENHFTKLEVFSYRNALKVAGIVDVPPQSRAEVSTFMEGYVKDTPLLIGDYVKKGQRVVTLEHTAYVDIQQNYLEVAERLKYLKAEFKRQKSLWEEQISSEKNYIKAQSDYKSQMAIYNGLKQKLKMMHIDPQAVEAGKITSVIHIYAPIEGYITAVNVSNGSFISSDSVIMEIINTNHIHLELPVFEKDIMSIKKEQDIVFTIPESSDREFNAKVYLVGTKIDPKTRRVIVHAHIDEEDENKETFVVGMFAEARIFTSEEKQLGLPKTCIMYEDDMAYIYQLKSEDEKNYSFKKVFVDEGGASNSHRIILNTDELKGSRILREPHLYLKQTKK